MCPSDFVIHAGLVTQSDDLTANVTGSVRPTSVLPHSPLRHPANLTELQLSKVPAQRIDSRCDVSENQPYLQPASVPPNRPRFRRGKRLTKRQCGNWTRRTPTLIHATEGALFERWQELGDDPGNTRERATMEAAAEDLLAVKIHRLGWPDPCR
jgi:hypothetical protein